MLRRHPSAQLILEIDVCGCPFLSLTIKQASVYSAVQGGGKRRSAIMPKVALPAGRADKDRPAERQECR